MWLNESLHDKYYTEAARRPLMQKDPFPVNTVFRKYLNHYGREIEIPVLYSDLTHYSHANSLKDKKGKWTHWENAIYDQAQGKHLRENLIKTYCLLKKHTKQSGARQYEIESINFCEYGNSVPFRIKIIERNNGSWDFFYIKQSDASRVYGLELEHLLTDNSINFIHYKNTLVEEHIAGVPGDLFLLQSPLLPAAQKAALASAFVQFNESCFARLLGDMRSYNFVVNTFGNSPALKEGTAPEINDLGYGIRAIDFDQQCYEGKKILYFPAVYKENAGYVDLVLQHLDPEGIEQNRQLQFNAMASRIKIHRRQLKELMDSMVHDELSENYKIQNLRAELNEHFSTHRFMACKTMGAIVKQQLKQVLQKHIKRNSSW